MSISRLFSTKRINATRLLTLLLVLTVIFPSTLTAPQPVVAASCNVGGYIVDDITWGPTLCDPYIVTGSIIIDTGAKLTIAGGTRVRFTSGKSITVRDGRLDVMGSAGNEVLLTSDKGTPVAGDWGYIYYGQYSDGTMQYATVEYGGGSALSGVNGAILVSEASPTIEHVMVRKSAGHGVYVWSGAPIIKNSVIQDNDQVGVYYVSGASVAIEENRDGPSFCEE